MSRKRFCSPVRGGTGLWLLAEIAPGTDGLSFTADRAGPNLSVGVKLSHRKRSISTYPIRVVSPATI